MLSIFTVKAWECIAFPHSKIPLLCTEWTGGGRMVAETQVHKTGMLAARTMEGKRRRDIRIWRWSSCEMRQRGGFKTHSQCSLFQNWADGSTFVRKGHWRKGWRSVRDTLSWRCLWDIRGALSTSSWPDGRRALSLDGDQMCGHLRRGDKGWGCGWGCWGRKHIREKKCWPGTKPLEPTFEFELKRKIWLITLRSGMLGGRRKPGEFGIAEARRMVWNRNGQTVECRFHMHEVWWTKRPLYLPLIWNWSTFSQISST